jgi:hypothetical protein
MRQLLLISVVAAPMFLYIPSTVASGALEHSSIQATSWQKIVEVVSKGLWMAQCPDLLEKQTPNEAQEDNDLLKQDGNYLFSPGNTIVIRISPEKTVWNKAETVKVNLARWNDGLWRKLPAASATVEKNRLKVDGFNWNDGFYRLAFDLETKTGRRFGFETYAIVAENWKRDLLAYCKTETEKIEMNPDSTLMHSSIAVSYFDSVMQMAVDVDSLSGSILTILADAVQSRDLFARDQCPKLLKGLSKIKVQSYEGGPIAEFTLHIPSGYSPSIEWPVFIYMRGRIDHNDMITLEWQGLDAAHRHPKGPDLQWKHYQMLMDVLNKQLNIDNDRIYLNGECGGGIPAMGLALRHPDHFAEVSMSFGNSYRHLAANALNLPVVFVLGLGHKAPDQVGYYDFAVKCFQYHGCKNLKYSRDLSTAQARGSLTPNAVREKKPHRILYRTESLHNPGIYWADILGREDENFSAEIDICAWGQDVMVKLQNVDAYRLDLENAPIDVNRPMRIIENGKRIRTTNRKLFVRRSRKYSDATLVKNRRQNGPVYDAFTQPHVVVYGSGQDDPNLFQITKDTAKLMAKGAPCFADVNLPNEMIDSHNLILLGNARTNTILSNIAERLPVRHEAGRILSSDNSYEGENMGFFLIYPNPMNQDRYVVVLSAISTPAMEAFRSLSSQITPYALFTPSDRHDKQYVQVKPIQPADVGIFEVDNDGKIKWHILEKFDTLWNWHSDWKKVLAQVTRRHRKWRWRQWVAGVIRRRLDADVVVCEDPFKSADLGSDFVFSRESIAGNSIVLDKPVVFVDTVPVDQITMRSLSNCFRNDWLVKIRLRGKSLREIMMVPFRDISKRKVGAPVIEGIGFGNSDGSPEGKLALADIEDEKNYTLACPYKILNGERIGTLVQDYKIVADGYLIELLRDYLLEENDKNIDSQLEAVKPGII